MYRTRGYRSGKIADDTERKGRDYTEQDVTERGESPRIQGETQRIYRSRCIRSERICDNTRGVEERRKRRRSEEKEEKK